MSSNSNRSSLVWLDPKKYDSVAPLWHDQYIWSPGLPVDDTIPLHQTSFIDVGGEHGEEDGNEDGSQEKTENNKTTLRSRASTGSIRHVAAVDAGKSDEREAPQSADVAGTNTLGGDGDENASDKGKGTEKPPPFFDTGYGGDDEEATAEARRRAAARRSWLISRAQRPQSAEFKRLRSFHLVPTDKTRPSGEEGEQQQPSPPLPTGSTTGSWPRDAEQDDGSRSRRPPAPVQDIIVVDEPPRREDVSPAAASGSGAAADGKSTRTDTPIPNQAPTRRPRGKRQSPNSPATESPGGQGQQIFRSPFGSKRKRRQEPKASDNTGLKEMTAGSRSKSPQQPPQPQGRRQPQKQQVSSLPPPRPAGKKSSTPRTSLKLDLNLEVEVQLKVSIRGDLTLSLFN
ncbi:hypothetical protein KJ359_004825 [Pestalotiopsis sp. 9143b]|nr:hypothetical protein KJ359_004825 [Pestalotiopsis sp. 9143b]